MKELLDVESRVLTFGDVMLDRYWHGGHTSRISPEAPVPVVKVEAEGWCGQRGIEYRRTRWR